MSNLYARKAEIVEMFVQAGRSKTVTVGDKEYDNIIPVTYKDGNWCSDLSYPLAKAFVAAVCKANGLNAMAWGQKALENATNKGLTQKAANIAKINIAIEKYVEAKLEPEFGYLRDVQAEFFDIVNELSTINAKMNNLNLDVTVDDVEVANIDIEAYL